MGVRISIYTLNLVRAEEVAQMTLSDLLWLYSEQEYDGQEPSWLWVEAPDLRVYAKRGGVYVYKGQKTGEVTRAEMEEIPLLARTIREYLAGESSFTLMRLLDCFSAASVPNWAACVSRGHRRWWIGSFLNEIAAIYGKSSERYQRMVGLLKTVLSGYDCGIELPTSESETRKIDFPLLPLADFDLRMGIWTNDDVQFLLGVLNSIPADTVFKPTEKVGIAPTAENWNQWVWDVLRELLVLQTVPYESLGVVTFIG